MDAPYATTGGSVFVVVVAVVAVVADAAAADSWLPPGCSGSGFLSSSRRGKCIFKIVDFQAISARNAHFPILTKMTGSDKKYSFFCFS